MKKPLYLLTGAAGFLGSAICRELINQDVDVRAFVLPNDEYALYLSHQVKIVEGDLLNEASLSTFFDVETDRDVYVIHCASIVTVNPTFSQKVYDVNVTGTENILKQCRMLGKRLKMLVYVGSTGTLGSKSGDAIYYEPSYFDPDHLPDCYSQTKAQASNRVLDCAHQGMPACIVMPTGILGPNDYSYSTTTSSVIEIIKGKLPVGIDGTFNLADVRDLAHGVYLASQKGRVGESYILGSDVISFSAFARTIAEAAETKPITRFLSCKMARLLAQISEFCSRISNSRPLLTTYSIDVLAQSNRYSSAKAMRELGYTHRPCAETIRDEVAFLRKEKMI